MRNSFEDMKRAMAEQTKTIVHDVDNNTERSVQKILQGPRPQPPSTPRRREKDGSMEEEFKKKNNVFKRALKGLSGRNSGDLERIEDMLSKILYDVEGLKDGQQFYQQSYVPSNNTVDTVKGVQEEQQQLQREAGPSAQLAGPSAGPSRQPSGKIQFQDSPHQHQNIISPIQENAVLDTPPREMRGESLPLDTPQTAKFPPNSMSLGNTPTKSEKHTKRESGSSSLFPKISRWSETTASSGLMKSFLGKGKDKHEEDDASRSNSSFNFWETENAKNTAPDTFASPFGTNSERTERPASPLLPPPTQEQINKANRISLDLQHPRPRQPYNHQLETQAQQLTENGNVLYNPAHNASVSSLGNHPPLGPGGFQNGKLLSPLAQEAYLQHQAQTSPQHAPQPKIHEQPSMDSETTTRSRKHRDRDSNGEKIPRKHRTEEEKARRRERKERKERERAENGEASPGSSRKKSRDLLSPDRTPSTASRLNGPRPLSSASNREKRMGSGGRAGSISTTGSLYPVIMPE
jgi:hypothetical protein